MRKPLKNILLSLFLCFSPLCHAETVVIDFGNGKAYIPQENGHDDLNSVRIEYDSGDIFLGKATDDGYPIYGVMSNYRKNEFYTGGFDENENYTGKGTLDTPNFTYEGEFKDGKRHGFGIFIDKRQNTTYEGYFLNDKKNGKGTEYSNNSNYSYSGDWKYDLYNGQGRLVSKSGTTYEGTFVNGKVRGLGKKINSDGSVLNGNWQNSDIMSGADCSFYGTDGRKFSGEIVDGKFEGYGSYKDSSGNFYEGSFSGNQRTGIGQQSYVGKNGKVCGVYTGSYFGNQRSGNGTFEFANGMLYEGGFINGQFYGTGYLSSEENDEITIIASDGWDGMEVPQNSEAVSSADDASVASVRLPKNGKILFSNGDMWEGFMSNGLPVAGLGIWTTQEERLARLSSPDNHAILASYQLNDTVYDLSSVYDAHEVFQIISSEAYLAGWNDSYKKHKPTIDKIIGGLQLVAGVLSIIPSPIQPIAAAVDIGLSVVQISLKTVSTSIDIYDACVAGNSTLIPGMLKDYAKDIVWDAINVIIPAGGGKAIEKVSAKAAEGMGKAGRVIANVIGKAVSKNKTLSLAAERLSKLGKVGGAAGRALIERASKSKFCQFVARNGGKLTNFVKTKWISAVYPALFAKYGDDATRLLLKYGNDISEQLAKNGDVIVRAAKSNGDEIARLFLKNGDEIAKVARASEYPDAVVRYIKNSGNVDDAIRLARNNPSLGKIVGMYGDEAIKVIEKYGDDAVSLFNKYGDDFAKALKKVSAPNQEALLKILKNYPAPEYASLICKGDTDLLVNLLNKAGVRRQKALLDAIKRNGAEVVEILNKVPSRDFRRTVDFLDAFDVPTYKKLAKNGQLPEEITTQVIRDSKNNSLVRDSISGKLKNKRTGESVNYVNHDSRYKNKKTQELNPNITYRTGEGNYYYKTDEFGRIDSVETDKLRLQEDIRKTDSYTREAHNSKTLDKVSTDDAGHIVAGRFGGSGELDNLISQNAHLNKGEWKAMENTWVKALEQGGDVRVKIDIVYEGTSKRPSEFIVTQIIDGKVEVLKFLNI